MLNEHEICKVCMTKQVVCSGGSPSHCTDIGLIKLGCEAQHKADQEEMENYNKTHRIRHREDEMKVTKHTTVFDIFCEASSNLAVDEKIRLLEAIGIPKNTMVRVVDDDFDGMLTIEEFIERGKL